MDILMEDSMNTHSKLINFRTVEVVFDIIYVKNNFHNIMNYHPRMFFTSLHVCKPSLVLMRFLYAQNNDLFH